MARYLNIYKSGQSKNKKINSSWNTHSIKKRPCTFLRIMISYLCVKFQSLTSLRCRDILVTDGRTDKRTDKRTDECEFIGHRFVKPVTKKLMFNNDHYHKRGPQQTLLTSVLKSNECTLAELCTEIS